MEKKDIYDTKEIANELGITTKTLRRIINSGELEAFKCGGLWRITREAYIDFTKRGRER